MEEFRRNRLNELIVIIQTKFRSYIQRKRFLQLKHSQIAIARRWRARRVSFHIDLNEILNLLSLNAPFPIQLYSPYCQNQIFKLKLLFIQTTKQTYKQMHKCM